MARYLVTGIAGFIGSSLARTLVAQGHSVRGMDNLSTGKMENLSDIADRIDFRKADILDADATCDACRGIDFVLHEAALPSVAGSIEEPMASHRANAEGTVNVLLAARCSGVQRVVYASSCAVYGDDAQLPSQETARPRPISPYAVSKLAGEMYMESFYHVYGLETVSLRYFNVFGPCQDATSAYSGAIAAFIAQMVQTRTPTIYGDGEQSRDFTFVENIVAANLLACTAPKERVAGQVFNIGTASRITINRVYRAIQKLMNFPSEPIYAPARVGDIRHSYADISLALDNLGYTPCISFEEGIRRTVDWYAKNMALSAVSA
jgi:nucleoside-diphosphate-sugar epimerase